MRAFLVHVRPVVEYNSIIWSPATVRDIDSLESVQRRFTKRLPGLKNINYYDRLERLNVATLELRHLRADLLWCYKVDFGLAHVNVNEFLEFSSCDNTRGHKYRLFKHQTTACVRSIFFCERAVNVWNFLPDNVCFDSFYWFRCSIMRINLSSHLRYCARLSWFSFSFIYFMRVINIVKVN